MGLRERDVVDHFRRWLEAHEWQVAFEVKLVDVIATRNSSRRPARGGASRSPRAGASPGLAQHRWHVT